MAPRSTEQSGGRSTPRTTASVSLRDCTTRSDTRAPGCATTEKAGAASGPADPSMPRASAPEPLQQWLPGRAVLVDALRRNVEHRQPVRGKMYIVLRVANVARDGQSDAADESRQFLGSARARVHAHADNTD